MHPGSVPLLAEQVRSPGDPRLRALGLIAAFVLDPARYASQVIERPHFGERHVAAVRVRERIDERDIAQELTNRRGTETKDSALLVYDVLLLGMGELQPQPENVARMLQSDSEVARTRGRLALQYLFRDPQPVVGDEVVCSWFGIDSALERARPQPR